MLTGITNLFASLGRTVERVVVSTAKFIGESFYNATKGVINTPSEIKKLNYERVVRPDMLNGLTQGALYHQGEARELCIAKLKRDFPLEYAKMREKVEAKDAELGIVRT